MVARRDVESRSWALGPVDPGRSVVVRCRPGFSKRIESDLPRRRTLRHRIETSFVEQAPHLGEAIDTLTTPHPHTSVALDVVQRGLSFCDDLFHPFEAQ